MGSWNDIVLRGSDDEDYHRISENLYRLINAAAVEAVNGSFAAAGRS
jgi:hypothetical protein